MTVWTDQMKHDKSVVDGKRETYICVPMLVMHISFSLQACSKKIIEEKLGKQSFEVKPFIDAVSIAKVCFDSLTHF